MDQLERVRGELAAQLGERLVTSDEVRQAHGRDPSWHAPRAPDAVAYPESEAEIAAILRLCNRERLPVIPYGTGTSIEGQVIASRGGLTVDLSRMNRILAINERDMDCVVQAGVTRKQLNRALEGSGLFFPVDPGPDASLGGMAATRASGTNAVRYGTMRDNVLALRVVLPDGRAMPVGRRARKSSAGYDLARLFVGSEGTLGIISELTLRLHNLPPAISAAVVSFEGIDAAVEATIATIRAAIPVARIELLDEITMGAVNRYSGLDYPLRPTLFLEFHGTPQAVREQAEQVGEIMARAGGSDFQWATDRAERDRLWQARHDAYYASLALRPGAAGITTDVCVPISRLADCIHETKAELAQSALLTPLVGHVGDGNFHLIFLVDPTDEAEIAEAKRLNGRLVERALAMDGTCTGEHGVGLGKRQYLRAEHGEALELMAQIKQLFDPNNIMNPGKLIPDPGGEQGDQTRRPG